MHDRTQTRALKAKFLKISQDEINENGEPQAKYLMAALLESGAEIGVIHCEKYVTLKAITSIKQQVEKYRRKLKEAAPPLFKD